MSPRDDHCVPAGLGEPAGVPLSALGLPEVILINQKVKAGGFGGFRRFCTSKKKLVVYLK